ncbi:S8 family serine peptidase [Ornithinimicrobium murale]|uniref:S8 family serine peptidase n=1 Tax=Ornithinimicrobium murale TaxID=1050153 RepID=UPI000E0D55B6|nr:S8 family serine peptidase [Ornithinimicrobium murale]
MRHPSSHPGVRAALGGTLALGLVTAALPSAGHAAPGDQAPTATESALSTASLTLVTGDTLRVTEVGDGRRTVALEPGEGREDITIHQLELDGELHVLPLDALPYVAEGDLDPDLFNIDLLLEAGYGDAESGSLPLIATYAEGRLSAAGSPLSTVQGVDPGVELESIDGRALSVAKQDTGEFWASLTGVPADEAAEFAATGDQAGLTSSVERLWLDAPVRTVLHESTAQIGAPTAWEAGIDGTGVTVAVLDTGVDADHPDLAGQVTLQEDFSGSGNLVDHVGHGTHVAATAAGTGDGSDGLRKGVAPGASIISGKVLGDDGNGATSGVIAGMEWAVAQDADVINMSLGGGATDGTDPLSQALNALSGESDSLFVVSAGNDGPGSSTIGSPGSADAALTVGAVDRDETLADFSSRGPRLTDLAVKPDLTAPGVGIVAARADGTSMGSPLDDLYTAANGTSMAAPHVAGAAALLAAQHPEWDGEQLKDALTSTAATNPDLTTYQQGGGRVDLSRAVTQELTATGSVHLGTFQDEDTEPGTFEVTYTNTGEDELVLGLDLDLSDLGGDAPSDGGVTLSADTVTVPAGETATVSVTVDPTVLERGQFTGFLHAQAGDTQVHTTLAVVKVAPTHEVTLTGVGFDGEPAFVSPIVLLGEDPRFDSLGFVWPGETVTFTVGEGNYFLHAMMTPEVDGLDAAVVVTDPDLEVTGDLEVVLDAREANEVRIETPDPATTRGNLGFITHREFHGRSVSNSTMKFDSTQSVWVTPTDEPQEGTFEFSSRWQLGTPVLTGRTIGRDALEVYPWYERYSPQLASARPLELVDAGAGTPADYEDLDVEGKIAVVELDGKGQQDVDAAVAAGAAGLMIAPESQWWTKYTGRGNRLDLPVVVLTPADGQEILERLEEGRVRMRFTGNPDRPVTYDVMQVTSGAIPEDVVHTVNRHNSATVTARYHETGGEEWTKEQRFAWRPWQRSTIVETQQELHTPQQRTEIVSAGDTLWRQHVLDHFSWDSLNPIRDGAFHEIRSYEPGEKVRYDWHRAVVRPTVTEASAPVRTGDTLSLRIPELATGDGTLAQRSSSADTTMTLSQGGAVLHEGDAAWGDYSVGDGQVQLDLSVVREGNANWDYSTRTDTSWTFDSTGAGEDSAVQPLLSVDYDVPVGLDNTVPAGSNEEIAVTVTHPDGLPQGGTVEEARLWASVDDGATWTELATSLSGGSGGAQFTARMEHPDGEGHVSLRVEATDADGNSVEQTVIRAYGIQPG